jgi:CCR4-NOT transcription complex subunit 2
MSTLDRPLWPTFGSPFDERPVVPEFTVPAAYNVTNVPVLSSQMNSFTDETLIMIFYENPRDVKQEQAAQTLIKRDWRWHTTLQQWMMKDASMGVPHRINDKQERGVYIFFDVNNWRRERREFLLNYDEMYPRIPSGGSSL